LNAKYAVCIPTYNAGTLWEETLKSVAMQDLAGFHKLVVDSGSTDNTVALAEAYGFTVIKIDKAEFNHGATRQMLADSTPVACEICIFMTHDAILATPDSLSKLVEAFNDEGVGIAYGRQLPHKNAMPLEAHLRSFNYPAVSNVRSVVDKEKLGFKVFFCSNSFSSYRKTALREVGGFPTESIMGEDAIVGAKMIKAGFKIAYVAEAAAHHSHDYKISEEFKRYFDTRVFHEQNNWLIKEYGKPTGEGLKFVKSELKYAFFHHQRYIVKSIASIFAKWLGYKMGGPYKKMPPGLVKKLSMHKYYWQ
jgi:rhamnosyltransferase